MKRPHLILSRRSFLISVGAGISMRPNISFAASAWPDRETYFSSALSFSAFLVQLNEDAAPKLPPGLQALAHKIATDQKQTGDQLRALGRAAPSPLLNDKQEIYLARMRKERPELFQEAYLKIEWMEANKAWRLHQAYVRNGVDPDLRAIASAAVPALTEHQDGLAKAFRRQF